ncbi:hypothetical protein AB0J68_06595 [Micromonospora sp. NPDC049580]|uniref:hypothetical protein n=1 Tax=Micromonospora sp. NPDC049580 TaxID=3154832 RepID=UPI00343EE63B
MDSRRVLAWGLPLLLVMAAAALYLAIRPADVRLAGTPTGPLIPTSGGELLGAPVGLANGEVVFLMVERGGWDSPQALFSVHGDDGELDRMSYWDWEMECPNYYTLERIAGRGGDGILAAAYCHGEGMVVDLLNPAHTSMERWGGFDAVASVSLADDGSGILVAKPSGAACLTLLRRSTGTWSEAASEPGSEVATGPRGACRFDDSQPLFVGAVGTEGVYVVQGRTLWLTNGRQSLVEQDLPFEVIRGVATIDGQRLAVSGRVGGRDGLWLYSFGGDAVRLRVVGRFGELSRVDGGVLTGQSVGGGTRIVRIAVR